MDTSRPAARTLALVVERRFLREAGELALVALAFLLYFIVRGNVADRTDLAMENARKIVDFQRSLDIFIEPRLQEAILGSQVLVQLFNAIYFWLDFPLIVALGLYIYYRRRRQYTFTRDAILFSGGLALIAYHLFPVAPPRLFAEAGMIDTLQQYTNLSYQAQSTEFFVNPYAAMPSLHVGWALLVAVGVVWAFPGSRLVLLLAILHPVSQTASTLVTGNHYILDAVGGGVAAAGGLALALAMQRFGYPALRNLVPERERAGRA